MPRESCGISIIGVSSASDLTIGLPAVETLRRDVGAKVSLGSFFLCERFEVMAGFDAGVGMVRGGGIDCSGPDGPDTTASASKSAR